MVEHKHNMDYRSLLSLVVGGVILFYASYGLDGFSVCAVQCNNAVLFVCGAIVLSFVWLGVPNGKC